MKYLHILAAAILISFNAFAQETAVVDRVIKLPEVGYNLSGITYNYDTNTYFMIQNNSGTIFEYDESLSTLLRTIRISNLKNDDTEDIVYLGNNKYAISEEQNVVYFLTIEPGQVEIDGEKLARQQLPHPQRRNLGLEGVCVSHNTDVPTFYAVQEKRYKRIFRWEMGSSKVSQPFNAEKILKHVMSDLSSCTFDDVNNQLLLLSHEDSRIMVLDTSGKVVKTIDIPRVADQYEGITFGPKREIVLVSEPNIAVILK